MKSLRQKVIYITVVITVLTAVMGLSCSKPESEVSVQIAPPALEETPVPEPVSSPTLLEWVPRISIEELLGKMESNANIVIVDTRYEDQYNVDHIKGAVSAPLATIIAGQWVPPSDKEIILYCS
ncbi:MAG: rhodanese-like domain-containing protein [Chloroflexi bacterium]|nr:rhodanese-like domain-containing protein [Chloroflexota bacterium]